MAVSVKQVDIFLCLLLNAKYSHAHYDKVCAKNVCLEGIVDNLSKQDRYVHYIINMYANSAVLRGHFQRYPPPPEARHGLVETME